MDCALRAVRIFVGVQHAGGDRRARLLALSDRHARVRSGAAERAGIKAGDIIETYEDREIART